MTVQINYKNSGSKKILANFILFVDEKFNINSLKKHVSNHEFSYIYDLLKTTDIKKNLLAFDINSKKKIILVSIKKNYLARDIENLGAELFGQINNGKKRTPVAIIITTTNPNNLRTPGSRLSSSRGRLSR